MSPDAYTEERHRIEESLNQTREDLSEAVGELRQAAREVLTPGEVIARRPYVWLAAALAIGFLMGRRAENNG